jgi:hypothetical protein
MRGCVRVFSHTSNLKVIEKVTEEGGREEEGEGVDIPKTVVHPTSSITGADIVEGFQSGGRLESTRWRLWCAGVR